MELGKLFGTLFTLFSRMNSRILDNKLTTSCFEWQKTVHKNVIMVKVCEKCFIQTQNDSNRRYLPLWKTVLHLIRLVWTFKGILLSKNFGGGREIRKEPQIDIHLLLANNFFLSSAFFSFFIFFYSFFKRMNRDCWLIINILNIFIVQYCVRRKHIVRTNFLFLHFLHCIYHQ